MAFLPRTLPICASGCIATQRGIVMIAVRRNGPHLLFAVAWLSVAHDLSTVAVRTLLALFFEIILVSFVQLTIPK